MPSDDSKVDFSLIMPTLGAIQRDVRHIRESMASMSLRMEKMEGRHADMQEELTNISITMNRIGEAFLSSLERRK